MGKPTKLRPSQGGKLFNDGKPVAGLCTTPQDSNYGRKFDPNKRNGVKLTPAIASKITGNSEIPTYLKTLEDFEKAPEGTMVQSYGLDSPYMKCNDGFWYSSLAGKTAKDTSASLCRGAGRKVIAWGDSN